jgi:dethiobiotin synthetase
MRLFVTGTDTGVGKTQVCASLMAALAATGKSVVGMKPVATGARASPAGLRSADALALMRAATVSAGYADVNPYPFADPIPPQSAAERAGVTISGVIIQRHLERLSALADVVLVEGIGGWRVPLASDLSLVDLVRDKALPVLLVVGVKLGCINHALLSIEAIRADGVHFAGWIANRIDPDYPDGAATIGAIAERAGAAPLAELPWIESSAAIAAGRYLGAAARRLLDIGAQTDDHERR